MPVTFHDLRDQAYRDVSISETYHGEKVLLIRNLGTKENQQAVQAAIDAARVANQYITCTVSMEKEDPDLSEEARTVTRCEMIWVQCCRDPKSVDSNGNPLLGLANPNFQDAILRSTKKDPLQLPYFFAHEIKNPTDVLWQLLFARYVPISRGAPG